MPAGPRPGSGARLPIRGGAASGEDDCRDAIGWVMEHQPDHEAGVSVVRAYAAAQGQQYRAAPYLPGARATALGRRRV